MTFAKAAGMALAGAAVLYLLTHHWTTAIGGGVGIGIAYLYTQRKRRDA